MNELYIYKAKFGAVYDAIRVLIGYTAEMPSWERLSPRAQERFADGVSSLPFAIVMINVMLDTQDTHSRKVN